MAKIKLVALEKKLLHYTGCAIEKFNLINQGDRILLGLSGGKDSLALVRLLHILQQRAKIAFTLKVAIVEQGWPIGQHNGSRNKLEAWLKEEGYDYHFENTNIAEIVTERIQKMAGKASGVRVPCMLCSRMRRGVLYRLAREFKCNKLALGHHRDDLISSLFMSICYNGHISSMPPKLLNDEGDVVLIRPLVYCQERDIAHYANELELPVCTSGCGMEGKGMRVKTQQFIEQLAKDNPKVPSNMLHALEDVRLSHLLDRQQLDATVLESLLSA